MLDLVPHPVGGDFIDGGRQKASGKYCGTEGQRLLMLDLRYGLHTKLEETSNAGGRGGRKRQSKWFNLLYMLGDCRRGGRNTFGVYCPW